MYLALYMQQHPMSSQLPYKDKAIAIPTLHANPVTTQHSQWVDVITHTCR